MTNEARNSLNPFSSIIWVDNKQNIKTKNIFSRTYIPSAEIPLIINERKKKNRILVQQIIIGCLTTWRNIGLFLNIIINRNSPTIIPKTKNLIAKVGSVVEKETINGIIAINILRSFFKLFDYFFCNKINKLKISNRIPSK